MAIAIASRILQDTISTSGVLHHRRLPRTIFRCSYSPTGAKAFRSPNSPPLLASLWRSEKSQETFRLEGGFRYESRFPLFVRNRSMSFACKICRTLLFIRGAPTECYTLIIDEI